MLIVEGLEKSYRTHNLFEPISTTLAPGQGLGVYGENGCGKTTFLDMIAGLVRPSAGHVETQGTLSYVMQKPAFQESLSFKDNLFSEAYLCGLRGADTHARVEEVAERCGLTSFWKKRYAKGSAGMKARLSVAAALIPNPDIMLLDEAFNFLDQASTEQIKSVLLQEKQRGMTLLMVSHHIPEFSGLCESVLVLPESTFQGISLAS